ncbi:AMP-binding protein, partial [Streptomyces sp. 6N223]|uniref:AMP-binding protein n=1 Tax=Streptomyces sp. 6N223 TaxID=3457412 RepID=UPI003FD513EC
MSHPRESSAADLPPDESPARDEGIRPATLPELFEAQVMAAPAAPAVESEGVAWSYGELNERANRIAHWLMGRGIGPERVVGVAMPRCAEQVAVVLGIVKAGAAYLPIDPAYPAERIRYIAEDAGPELILTSSGTPLGLSGDPAGATVAIDAPETHASLRASLATNPSVRLDPARPAYVIYTSGSTGRPKGVSVTHAGLVGFGETLIGRADV